MRPPTAALVRARLCTARTARLPLLRARIAPPARLLPTLAHPRQLSTAPPKPALISSAASPASPVSPAAAAPDADPYAGTETSLPLLTSTINTRILSSQSPSESEILAAFSALHRLASHHLSQSPPPPTTPASALLTLAPSPAPLPPLSDLSYSLLSHPPVFLTPAILSAFVSLQRLLRDPSPIPAAFTLYATKPPVRNPNRAKYAIPASVALAGLECAIEARDMVAALDVIDTSYARPAFRRNKVIRRAVPFGLVAGLAPAALWVVAEKLAGLQDTVDLATARGYAFGGLLAYAGLTTWMGLLAVGTANDQMVRVTWVVGTPLRERWLREEERAALDAVAMAWGFEEVHRRGFEEGEEWELLREVCGRKGMTLDEPSLMEGME